MSAVSVSSFSYSLIAFFEFGVRHRQMFLEHDFVRVPTAAKSTRDRRRSWLRHPAAVLESAFRFPVVFQALRSWICSSNWPSWRRRSRMLKCFLLANSDLLLFDSQPHIAKSSWSVGDDGIFGVLGLEQMRHRSPQPACRRLYFCAPRPKTSAASDLESASSIRCGWRPRLPRPYRPFFCDLHRLGTAGPDLSEPRP